MMNLGIDIALSRIGNCDAYSLNTKRSLQGPNEDERKEMTTQKR